MKNINHCLEILSENKETLVRIKGTKNADGKNLYDVYPWFKDEFPKGEPITGIVWGQSMDNLKSTGFSVIFAKIKDKKVIKKFGHKATFTSDQVEEI